MKRMKVVKESSHENKLFNERVNRVRMLLNILVTFDQVELVRVGEKEQPNGMNNILDKITNELEDLLQKPIKEVTILEAMSISRNPLSVMHNIINWNDESLTDEVLDNQLLFNGSEEGNAQVTMAMFALKLSQLEV